MMIMNNRIILWPLFLLACLAVVSCVREAFEQAFDGRDVLVTFGYSVPEMRVVTRSDMTDADARTLNSLWVGVFASSDGKLVGSKVYDDVSVGGFHEVKHLETSFEVRAGKYHIVAVGNIFDNYGVAKIGGRERRGELESLLRDVRDWQEYRSLAVVLPTAGTIEAAGGNLPMSGVYYDGIHATGGAVPQVDWESVCDTPVYVGATGMSDDGKRGVVRLPGAIHLRRMISQVRFNIKSRNTDILTIEPYSWQVFNVPELSWVHERKDPVDRNAGDVVTAIHSDRKDNYDSSPVYAGADFHFGADGFQTFDFWQMENKRAGIRGDSYKDREQEIPLGDGLNSGFYSCLTDRTDGTDFNNFASYVTIKCRIAYIDRTAGSETIGGVEIPGGMERTADVTYCVHLGYCEGDNEVARTRDFLCRRNTRYTYNLYVTGVYSLMVEAIADDEVQPGAEGLVSDVSDTYIELDAHFHAFNVQITREERDNFSFLIHAWYDNVLHRIEMKPDGTHNVADEKSDEFKFYSWVEFRPTVDERTIARYYPCGMDPASGDANRRKTFRLLDLRSDAEEYSAINDGNWYTVFINEHVYEDGPDERGGEWKKYVNQNSDRRLWLKVTDYKSSDDESMYLRSKYAMSQKSIQTYYDIDNSLAAIGVEHKNESLGYALRKDGTSGLSALNGRYNAVRFSGAEGGNALWENYVLSNAYWTPEINNQNYVSESHDAYMPGLSSVNASGNAVATDPAGTGSTVISVNNACMNRNRDLDGNGRIDPEEVRWFVPASSQYIRIILGRNSLHTPIMDYDGVVSLPAEKVGDATGNSRLHLGTSDNKQLWAEEGLSVGDLNAGGAWHVRCIRYLGTDLRDYGSADAGVITPSYVLEGNVVKMTYYDEKSVRQNRRTIPFPRHFVNNQDYNRVYKAFEIAPSNVVLNGEDGNPARPGNNEAWQDYLYNSDGTPKNNPCAGRFSGEGWRVPNQKECSIMRDLGQLEFVECSIRPSEYKNTVTNHLSCTQEFYDEDGVGGGPELHRFLGANKDISKAMDDGSLWGSPSYLPVSSRNRGLAIRCVRDVEP